MPLIETKGAASAQGFGGAGAGASGPVTYIEDVFSTWLYTGNSSTQTITNGIDLAGKGGMTWIKARDLSTRGTTVFDSARSLSTPLLTNTNQAGTNVLGSMSSFNSDGFSFNGDGSYYTNGSPNTYVSWTFRKQPKFFDVVTYTGNGANRTIAHSLGAVPGCIIVKRTDSAANWAVRHANLGNDSYLVLNSTGGLVTDTTVWNNAAPTAAAFPVGTSSLVNANGGTYVAYIFAHNAGGFGLSGTDNVISCGSYTGNGSATGPTITLGYEPQWLMIKNASGVGNWNMIDNMRGMPVGSADAFLEANTSDAEATADWVSPTATGFNIVSTSSEVNTNTSTYIYIAIRRGPMKVPTSGTSVFAPRVQTGEAAFNNSFPVDLVMERDRTSGALGYTADRLRGGNLSLSTTSTAAEFSAGPAYFDSASGTFRATFVGGASPSVVYENFGRAPGFFDVVCYTGTGANATWSHNLSAVPQMMIVKKRSAISNWAVYHSALGAVGWILLNSTAAASSGADFWQSTTPTAVNFYTGTNGNVGDSGQTYVAYLFATCAGVSKVGSYTGTGALQTINCGFTGGARFVLIKRTDSTGDWYVYDSARGISSSNDPYFFLNSTAAEVTGTNYVDTTSVGFQVTAAAPAGLNANGGTYIFLAIA